MDEFVDLRLGRPEGCLGEEAGHIAGGRWRVGQLGRVGGRLEFLGAGGVDEIAAQFAGGVVLGVNRGVNQPAIERGPEGFRGELPRRLHRPIEGDTLIRVEIHQVRTFMTRVAELEMGDDEGRRQVGVGDGHPGPGVVGSEQQHGGAIGGGFGRLGGRAQRGDKQLGRRIGDRDDRAVGRAHLIIGT